MRFYTQTHRHYCGIDLHARTMYVCIVDPSGQVLLHQNLKTDPERFLAVIAPYRNDLVVAVECIFCWYWLADLCAREQIAFVLGHALYMKAIHGGKSKNDKLDSHKIALLLKGGLLPQAYVYPAGMRATRDLLRRRMQLMRQRAGRLAHIQNTVSQYNLPPLPADLAHARHRVGLERHFPDPVVRQMVALELAQIDQLERWLTPLELDLVRQAKGHDAFAFHLLRSVPGIGKILALVILYELHDIQRFATVQQFASYCRLVKPLKESSGKILGHGGKKIGNAYLKWAFSEAAVLFLRGNEKAQAYRDRLASKHGKGKALSILAHKLGRAVYYMLKNRAPFDQERFMRTLS